MHEPPFSPVYPGLHSQAVLAILPAAEVEFDGQSEHSAGPSMALYLPRAQSTQSLFDADEPALQEQEIASAVTKELAGHASQLADPFPVLYVPAPHFKHVPPFSPVYPALHSQAVITMLPGGDIEEEGQPVQEADPKPSL